MAPAGLFFACTRVARIVEFQRLEQAFDRFIVDETGFAGFQPFRQFKIMVTHTHQAADLGADRFPEAPDLALTSLTQDNVVPVIAALPAAIDDLFKRGRPIVQFDAAMQGLQVLR